MPGYGFGFPTGLDADIEGVNWASGFNEFDQRFVFLNKAIGAADGTQIPMRIRERGKMFVSARWADKQENITMNTIAACRHDMAFSFVSTGCESCMSDIDVVQRSDLEEKIPDGHFLLFDAILHQTSRKILVPYRNVPYHLPELRHHGIQDTPEAIFNHRHSMKRSSRIERFFLFLKGRWAIRQFGQEGTFDTVTRTIIACFALHNFVQTRCGKQDTMEDVASEASKEYRERTHNEFAEPESSPVDLEEENISHSSTMQTLLETLPTDSLLRIFGETSFAT